MTQRAENSSRRRDPASADHASSQWVETNLAALSALLNLEDDAQSLRTLLRSLEPLFKFERALVLADTGSGVHCLAAQPESLIGSDWPGQSLPNALQVRAMPAGRDHAADAFPLNEAARPGEAALCLPIGVGSHPALLVLVRAKDAADFDAVDLTTARQCSAVSMATLAARRSSALEAEIDRLNQLLADLRENEEDAARARVLQQIIDHLPISLTVQDEDGRFILANAMAAANLAVPAEVLTGATPADFLPADEAASRREWEQTVIRQDRTITVEANVADAQGERSWLTSHTPARILDQRLLISSSIDITEHKLVERELVERAHTDELTGLPDRILIQDRVEEIIGVDGDNARFALAFIDLDNFKHINDYYSHATGDALLIKIGARIAERLRPGDMLARISGDEFLLLLNAVESGQQIAPIIDAILQDLKRPFHIEGFEVFSSCSIGVSIYPEHGRSFEELRRNADSAMYRAKHSAKGDAVIFDVNMGRAITMRMEVEQRLRLAIRDRHFCCAFQPKVDMHTQQVVGLETLVRWRDGGGDIHPPGEFIDLAVDLGLINPITNFVLSEAVASMDRLDAAFGAGTTVSINIAAKQANDLEFMRTFTQSLKDCGRADRMIVELTEDAFIAKGKFQTQILPLLREIGVRVSIDDFGTGYSSLSALADITADEIKIDRSFISAIHERPRNQIVLRAIESLGHALGMTIVAEGVETHEELAYLLAATRIRFAQGFYFARPIYLEELGGIAPVIGPTRTNEPARSRSETSTDAARRFGVPARSVG